MGAAVVGFFGYGVSLVLFVLAMRYLVDGAPSLEKALAALWPDIRVQFNIFGFRTTGKKLGDERTADAGEGQIANNLPMS